jgi:hypothetical protein
VNRTSGALALIVLAAAGVAAAQTSPGQSMPPLSNATPPAQYPSATNPPSTTSQSDSASQNAKDARKAQIKDCMAQQQANNTGMSRKEMKKYCKNQVDSTPPQG